MKIAYTGWTWLVHHQDNKQYELEQAIKELKYIGYDYHENFAFISDLYPDAAELKALLDKYDVKLVNMYGHYSDNAEQDFEKGKAWIDYMVKVGAKWYNTQGTCWNEAPFDRPLDREKVSMYAELSNRLGAYAKERGVTLCFHPHANSAVFSEEQIDFFCENTDPSVVKMCIDTAHTTIGGMDAEKAIKKYLPRIAYIHLKDVDPYTLTGSGHGTFRALGLGVVNFKGVVAALKAGGYDGVMCVELDNPEVCNFQSAQVSRQYIRDALKI